MPWTICWQTENPTELIKTTASAVQNLRGDTRKYNWKCIVRELELFTADAYTVVLLYLTTPHGTCYHAWSHRYKLFLKSNLPFWTWSNRLQGIPVMAGKLMKAKRSIELLNIHIMCCRVCYCRSVVCLSVAVVESSLFLTGTYFKILSLKQLKWRGQMIQWSNIYVGNDDKIFINILIFVMNKQKLLNLIKPRVKKCFN